MRVLPSVLGAFNTYDNEFSILLRPGKRPPRSVPGWQAWIPKVLIPAPALVAGFLGLPVSRHLVRLDPSASARGPLHLSHAGGLKDPSGYPHCQSDAAPTFPAGATVEETGPNVSRLTLTDKAVERLGLTTSKVKNGAGRTLETPYGALIYDGPGKTWVYTSPEPRTYIRAAVSVDRITGNVVRLLSGPSAGSDAVTLGSAELFGVDFGQHADLRPARVSGTQSGCQP